MGGITHWWVIVMMTPLVIVMILQLLSGLISQQPRRLSEGPGWRWGGGAVGRWGCFPCSAADQGDRLCLSAAFSNPWARTRISSLCGSWALSGLPRGPAGNGTSFRWPRERTAELRGVVVTAMAVIVVWILAFILMCSMIFRSFALIVLAAVAPVALMIMPWEKTKAWAGRWCEVVVALLCKTVGGNSSCGDYEAVCDSKSFPD